MKHVATGAYAGMAKLPPSRRVFRPRRPSGHCSLRKTEKKSLINGYSGGECPPPPSKSVFQCRAYTRHPMNIAKKPRPGKERPLPHTTSVRNGTIGQQFKTTQPGRMLNGPAVLLPRVGKPKLSKMVVFEPTEKTYISDCLIALRTVPEGEEKRLHNILRDA